MIFCIGNGKSRSNVDLDKLKKLGKVYGCNALYRDFTPDKLITNDSWMLKELFEAEYTKDNPTYIVERKIEHYFPRDHKVYYFEDIMDVIFPIQSGLCAIRLAYHFHPQEQIYMIGFDIFGNRDNIYDGTLNYNGGANFITPGYPDAEEAWKVQEDTRRGQFFLLKEQLCPGIRLTRVSDDNRGIENIDNITYEQFEREILWQ